MSIKIDNVLYNDKDIWIEIDEGNREICNLFLRDINDKKYLVRYENLAKVAFSSRDGMKLQIDRIDSNLILDAQERGLSCDSLALALTKAFLEVKRREKDMEQYRKGSFW